MSDASDQEKTEDPTPKKRQEAREEGQIPRSQELNTAVLLLGSVMVLNAAGPAMGESLQSMFGYGVTAASAGVLDANSAVALLRETGWKVLAALSALLLALMGIALAVTALQARGSLTSKPLAPKWERMSPLTNGKRMLGIQPWAELVKSLLKMLIVGVAVYASLSAAWPEIVSLVQQPVQNLMEVMKRYSLRLLVISGLSYVVFAFADYLYQVWQHEKGLKMSVQEIKDEAKQSEGDANLKARMRSLGRDRVRRQMFQDIPLADVIITNPTHRAVALKYDPEKHDAPVVLAMGQRKVAERIKALAAEHGVPTVENKPLAKALLASARVGTTIPPELYIAVAEVLAFVIRQRQARGPNWKGSTTV